MTTSKKLRTIAKGDNPVSNLLVVQNGLQLLNSKNSINIPDVLTYHIDLKKIKQIILDPRAEKYHTEAFLSYCKSKKFESLGIVFSKSNLYKIKT